MSNTHTNTLTIDVPDDYDEYFVDEHHEKDLGPWTPDTTRSPVLVSPVQVSPGHAYTFNNIDKNIPIEEIDLDMDHTIGSVSVVSIYVTCYQYFKKTAEYPPYEIFKWFFEGGAFRPYLKEFIQYVLSLKKRGQIKKLNIHTSVNNENGYVTWIARCVERYSDVPENTIDDIKDSSTGIGFTRCGATLKPVKPGTILFDDKPWYVQPSTRVVQAPHYDQYVDPDPVYKLFTKDEVETVKDAIKFDRQNFPPNMTDFRNDVFFRDIIVELEDYFGE